MVSNYIIFSLQGDLKRNATAFTAFVKKRASHLLWHGKQITTFLRIWMINSLFRKGLDYDDERHKKML